MEGQFSFRGHSIWIRTRNGIIQLECLLKDVSPKPLNKITSPQNNSISGPPGSHCNCELAKCLNQNQLFFLHSPLLSRPYDLHSLIGAGAAPAPARATGAAWNSGHPVTHNASAASD